MEKIIWKPAIRWPDGTVERFDSADERSGRIDALLNYGYTYCSDFWTCEVGVPESELYGW